MCGGPNDLQPVKRRHRGSPRLDHELEHTTGPPQQRQRPSNSPPTASHLQQQRSSPKTTATQRRVCPPKSRERRGRGLRKSNRQHIVVGSTTSQNFVTPRPRSRPQHRVKRGGSTTAVPTTILTADYERTRSSRATKIL